MRKSLATLATIVALSTPLPAQAIAGLGYCTEVLPVTVAVQRGDTLIELARANYNGNGSRYVDIARHNRIKDPNIIRVGQVLELPGKTYERERLVSGADFLTPTGGFGLYCRPYTSGVVRGYDDPAKSHPFLF